MQLNESAHVLLTGGTGFFGKALLRHWLAEHQAGRPAPRVTLLSRAPEKFKMQHPALAALPGLHCMAGDITATGSFPAVAFDVDGQARPDKKAVGADEFSTTPVTAWLLSPADVGPKAP